MGLYQKGLELQGETSLQNSRKGLSSPGVFRTDIDKLYHLIKVSKIITLDEVVMILGFTKGQVENWAKVLEHKSLIRIDYPPLGGTNFSIIEKKNG